MGDDSVNRLEYLAKVTVSRFIQFLLEKKIPVDKAHEGLEVAAGTILAEDNTELFNLLVSWFEDASGGAIRYNESARMTLAGHFRATAWMYKIKAVIYPYPCIEHLTKNHKNDSVNAPRCVICSDIHLGTKASRRQAFYEWLSKCHDTTIVLLGDILDLWIYSNSFDDMALARHVVAEWKDLWEKMSLAVERNCRIHYVPGNHDAFVYFVESESQEEWSKNIISRTPLLSKIVQLTESNRFLELADVHYPYLKLNVGGSDILFTHGHYSSWGWRLMAGLEDAPTPFPTAVTSASVVLAHKNAALLRKANNMGDWGLNRTHLIEDTAISITNALLIAYEGAQEMMSQSPSDFIQLIDNASALYFGTRTRVSHADKLRIREALLYIQRDRHIKESGLEAIKTSHLRYLNNRLSGTNISLSSQSGRTEIYRNPLSTYAKFDDFVFGHFHDPRDGSHIHDIGGFVDSVETFLSIEDNGEIHRRPLE